MIGRGSPLAIRVGRWGMALTLVTGAVLIGRLIRNFPYLLPNRLPGLVLYELGPGLVLAAAIGIAIAVTHENGAGLCLTARLALFTFAALIAGVFILTTEFAGVLQGQWL